MRGGARSSLASTPALADLQAEDAPEIDFRPETLTHLLEAEISPVEWLVRDLIPKASCVILAAEPKLGKTWVALDLSLALAFGLPLFGRFDVPSPVRTLLVLNEDGRRNVAQRYRSLLRGRGITPVRNSTDLVRILSRRAFSLEQSEYFEELERYVSEEEIGLVVLDPFTEMFNADERHERDVKLALQPLKRIRDRTGVSIFLTHHQRKPPSGKDGNGGRRAMALRGSSYLIGWYDIGLSFASGSPNEPVKVFAEAREVELPVPEFTLLRVSDPERGVWLEYTDEHSPSKGELQAMERVLAYVAENPGAIAREIAKAGGKESMNKLARERLVSQRRIVEIPGKGGKLLYLLTEAEERARGLSYPRSWFKRFFGIWACNNDSGY
jgi:hypothetical protein